MRRAENITVVFNSVSLSDSVFSAIPAYHLHSSQEHVSLHCADHRSSLHYCKGKALRFRPGPFPLLIALQLRRGRLETPKACHVRTDGKVSGPGATSRTPLGRNALASCRSGGDSCACGCCLWLWVRESMHNPGSAAPVASGRAGGLQEEQYTIQHTPGGLRLGSPSLRLAAEFRQHQDRP